MLFSHILSQLNILNFSGGLVYLQALWVLGGAASLQTLRQALNLSLGEERYSNAELRGGGDGRQQQHGAAEAGLSHYQGAAAGRCCWKTNTRVLVRSCLGQEGPEHQR